MSRIQFSATLAALCSLSAPLISGNTISLAGSLNPSDANDVFFFAFSLSPASDLTIQAYGYGGTSNAPNGTNAAGVVIPPGGFDPYISLYAGTGPSATFLAANDDGSCPPGALAPACQDSTLKISGLAAGSYTLALTVFNNFSFAENFGSGTLGDGFTGLGNYFDPASGTVRSSNYAVDLISTGSIAQTPVPEPGSRLLLLPCLCVLIGATRCARRLLDRRTR